MIAYDEMTTAELEAEVSAREADIAKIDQLARTAMNSRQWERALELDDERSRVLGLATMARGYLFNRQTRRGDYSAALG